MWGFRNGGGGLGVGTPEAGVGVVELGEGPCAPGAGPSEEALGLADLDGGVGCRETGSPPSGDRWSFLRIPLLIKAPRLEPLECEWAWPSPEWARVWAVELLRRRPPSLLAAMF